MTVKIRESCQWVDPDTKVVCPKPARHFFVGPHYNERYCGEHKKHSWFMMGCGGILAQSQLFNEWRKVTYEEYITHEVMKS